MFPIMPYPNYRSMSDEDVASIVVYMRSLPPVRHALPGDRDLCSGEDISSAMFRNRSPRRFRVPDMSTPAARGAYLVRMAACNECHTPTKRGVPIAGMDFAGGIAHVRPVGQRGDSEHHSRSQRNFLLRRKSISRSDANRNGPREETQRPDAVQLLQGNDRRGSFSDLCVS